MAKKQPQLSKRAAALFERVKNGDWYPAYSLDTPKAMQELIDAGLVMQTGRVQTIVTCYVPVKGFKPLQFERWLQ